MCCPQLPGVELVLFTQRVIFGSDYEDGWRGHFSELSSACARPDARHGFEGASRTFAVLPVNDTAKTKTLWEIGRKIAFLTVNADFGPY